ncbi:MAG: bifunctional diaminohydroxyphosphoribosylaminopyrimidine deaminase/5-amino-6-(5-phosphoribosylamino)uracil reductase RibD [Rickettsiales bacterium]|nr:bifunctional diaminohydroxyphosphoribosylaminopyrimidine deaminase/5-amino-6-(5-phosphoribosylamino)uracil reductase RibD [Rickettsiales bacterium]
MVDCNVKFISYALNLAKKNLGLTAPNPVVACVIVKNNQIIATGVTAKNGRPHAEIIAIEKVFDKKILSDCEIYVTLEPCSHFGKTSPCADEIIKHKFKKVIIALRDPDQRVNGNGIKKIQEAGIEVICGVLEKEAQEINRGFFKARQNNLPFFTLKIATSLDGKIATKNFNSKWITSDKARQFSHYLRAENDAIIVGANTIRKDNPSLDCRILGLEEFSPKKIIIARNLDFDLGLKIFQNNKENLPIIFTFAQKQKSENNFSKFEKLGVEIVFCNQKNDEIDLNDFGQKLCAAGVNSALIEGGKTLATAFLQADLIDELVWIRNKKIIGNDGISAISDLGFLEISQTINNFNRTNIRELPEEIIETFRKNKSE